MKKLLAILTVLLICALYIASFQLRAAANLVGYWKFDAGTGSTAIDSSGENVSGTFSSTAPTWSTDVPPTDFTNPHSLDFTRTGDGVSIAWPSALNFSSNAPRSFSFWYKPTGNGEIAAGNYDRIISWTNDAFEIAGTYGDVSVHRLAFYDGSWRDTGFNMTVGTWYNITFTYNGSNVILYVNNQQKYSGGSGGGGLSETMYIGTRHTGNEGINGIIDDVRVYDRALTADEVQELSEGGSGPGVPTPTPTTVPTPTSTPTPTFTPTATPASTATASSSDSASSTVSISCTAQSPSSAPDLFQVSTSPSSATLYFTPVSPDTGYTISYGTNSDANQHAVSFSHSDKSGAVSYTIHALSGGTTYYFKVQGKNNCASGGWSQVVSQTTTGGSAGTLAPASGLTPTRTSAGTITVIEKEQTASPAEKTADTKPRIEENRYELTIKVVNDGKPVEGATVEIHSTPRRTTTDKDGIARFSDMEKGDHTVYLSYEGYRGKENVTLDGKDKEVAVNLTVELKPNNSFFSPAAIMIIVFLCIAVVVLLFILWKRKRKSEEIHRKL